MVNTIWELNFHIHTVHVCQFDVFPHHLSDVFQARLRHFLRGSSVAFTKTEKVSSRDQKLHHCRSSKA